MVCYFVAFYFLGPTLKGTSPAAIGQTFGYLVLPFLIGGFFIRRAKTARQIYKTHAIHGIVLMLLVFNDFNKDKDLIHASIQNGCKKTQTAFYANSLPTFAPTEDEIDNYCRCAADGLGSVALMSVILNGVLLSEPEPIQSNPEMLEKANTVGLKCQKELGLS